MKALSFGIFILVLSLGIPAFAEDTGTMLPAAGETATTGVVTPEIYPNANAEGDQTWVRKYEGQRDQVWSLGTLNMLGYTGPWQFFLNGSEVLSNDTYLRTDFGYADNLWVRAYTSNGTRRIPLFPLQPPAEPGEVLLPVTLLPFQIDRGEHSARISINPTRSADFTIVADIWREHDDGNRPLPFRTRRGSDARANRTKFETTEPVDQVTTDASVGSDFRIGSAAISYRGSTNEFASAVAGPIITADFNPAEQIINSRSNDTKTRSHVVKLSMPLARNLSLTGNWSARDRTHSTTGCSCRTWAARSSRPT